MFWNGQIRLFMELFIELGLLACLNMANADWETPFPSVMYSNNLALDFLIVTCLLPVVFLLFYCYRRANWSNEDFQSRYGAFLDGTNLKVA